jgi:carbonic anhydrase
MCDIQNPASTADGPDRRTFLKRVTVATVAGLLGANLGGNVAYADALTKEQRDRMTPDEIIRLMRQGNERFRTGQRQERNFLREQQASAKGQYPAAVVLSCIDSRAPAEVVMDLGIGDIFNSRVAGNIANEDILGSMEFACQVAGAKVVLVMGHTTCGAIKGAIDRVQLGNLTNLLAKIRPAVEATPYDGERSSKNNAFVNAVARKNVELTMTNIRQQSSVLQSLESKGTIKIVGAMYDLDTALLEFLA